jgi:hypothetical protein
MCWKCGTELNIPAPVSRSEVCAKCGTDVRCCKNCAYYLPGAHYDCRETVAELVADKERANFCESFLLKSNTAQDGTGGNAFTKAKKARSDFDSLFS